MRSWKQCWLHSNALCATPVSNVPATNTMVIIQMMSGQFRIKGSLLELTH